MAHKRLKVGQRYTTRLRRMLRREEAAIAAQLEPGPPAPRLDPVLDQWERERRLAVDLRTHGRRTSLHGPWPTSGDPNIIGEHEVAPLRCGCCQAIIPWAIIKGWRN